MKISKIELENIANYNRVKTNLIRRLINYIKEFGSYEFSLDTQCSQSDTDFIAFDIVGAINELKLSVELDCKSTHYSIRRCYA